MTATLLKLHRWLALVFAVPLAVVIVTGVILSFEPWLVTGAIEPDSLSALQVQALLSRHDPDGRVRAMAHRTYDHTLTLGSVRDGLVVDTITGKALPGPSTLASIMVTARRLHEKLMVDAGWLVIASAGAMLALAVLGVLMGRPRLRNTLPGWHRAVAWGLLPVIVLSPLTGLLMASGVTFTTPPSSGAPVSRGAPLKLAEAIQIVAREHDLSALVWIRPRGQGMLARLAEDGEYRVYAVTRDGAVLQQRNWPRLWHEGNFAGAWSAAMNVVISAAMSGLLFTGLWIWLRRQVRRRARRFSQPATASFPVP
jgi:uncharacterized iron-regulated membrane protein